MIGGRHGCPIILGHCTDWFEVSQITISKIKQSKVGRINGIGAFGGCRGGLRVASDVRVEGVVEGVVEVRSGRMGGRRWTWGRMRRWNFPRRRAPSWSRAEQRRWSVDARFTPDLHLIYT